jgi:hypothetical protein
LLVCDDTSEQFKRWTRFFKTAEGNPFTSIFTQGRWIFLTLIIAIHDDTFLDPPLRSNVRVVFYMHQRVVSASFKKNNATNDERALAEKIAQAVFSHGEFTKLCYIRGESQPYFHHTPLLGPREKIGSDYLWKLSDGINKLRKEHDDSGALMKYLM